MKLFVILCLLAVSRAILLDTLGGGVNSAGHAPKVASSTVLHGLTDAEKTVGGVLGDVGHTLGDTFGDVWNLVKDPLAEVGKDVLLHAAEFAAEKGVEMALTSLAADKRESLAPEPIKAFLLREITDEYQKWFASIRDDVINSRQEMVAALSRTGFDNLPQDMKTYITQYMEAVKNKSTGSFIKDQADIAIKNALQTLPKRLDDRFNKFLMILTTNA